MKAGFIKKATTFVIGICLVASFALGGCAKSNQWDKTELEEAVKVKQNSVLESRDISEHVTQINLTQTSENKYEGTVHTTTGDSFPIHITTDLNDKSWVADNG